MVIKRIYLKLIFCMIAFLIPTTFLAAKPKNYDAIIYSTSQHRYKGFLESVSEEGITIDYFGQSKFISADSIQRIKIKRSNALKTHAFSGAALGLLAGLPVYLDGSSKGKLSLLALPVVLIGTTLTGTLAGSLVNAMTVIRNYKIQNVSSFKSIYPVLLRYSEQASATEDKN